MRYWQNEKGQVMTFSDNFDPNKNLKLTPPDPNRFWTEVVVTPKPLPKTWVDEYAIFCWPSSKEFIFTLDKKSANHYYYRQLIRLSDWVEVTFTEKSDV